MQLLLPCLLKLLLLLWSIFIKFNFTANRNTNVRAYDINNQFTLQNGYTWNSCCLHEYITVYFLEPWKPWVSSFLTSVNLIVGNCILSSLYIYYFFFFLQIYFFFLIHAETEHCHLPVRILIFPDHLFLLLVWSN